MSSEAGFGGDKFRNGGCPENNGMGKSMYGPEHAVIYWRMHCYLFEGTPYMMQTWETILIVGLIPVALLAVLKRPLDFPLSRKAIVILVGLCFIFGLVGAKILFIYLNRVSIFETRHLSMEDAFALPGYAFLGALFAEVAVLAAFTKLRHKKINFLVCADYLVPFTMLHQALVRIGCFLNGCCYGKPTKLPWGCVFADAGVKRHPTQLYEMVILVLIYFLMRTLYKRKSAPTGIVFFGTIGLYTALRFFVEFFRVDSFPVLGNITYAQVWLFNIAASCAIAIGIIILIALRKRKSD